jgi:DNA-binding NarL/FixJ family response regulator
MTAEAGPGRRDKLALPVVLASVISQAMTPPLRRKELAQALFITVKAVEVHLSSAYRKLQISSRGQLAEALNAG